MLRILVVEDHAAFRQALTFVLDQEPDFTVVAQVGFLAEARGALHDVDVAIVDLQLPDGSGLELVQPLCLANPHGAVLILTASGDRRQYAQAIMAGAAGVTHKSAALSEIVGAVRQLGQGGLLLETSELVDLLQLVDQPHAQQRGALEAFGQLTTQERQVLQALARGLNDTQIGEQLSISSETARTHMAHILGKLGVHSRLQALVFGVRCGGITTDGAA